MLRAVSSFATGRRSKWIVVAAWVIAGVALAGFQPKLQDSTTNENADFLPASADSTKVNDLLDERFADGREVPILIVYSREGGLTTADQAEIASDAKRLPGELRLAAPAISPYVVAGAGFTTHPLGEIAGRGSPDHKPKGGDGAAVPEAPSGPERTAPGSLALLSEDGTTAAVVIPTFGTTSDEIADNVEILRDQLHTEDRDGGLEAYVTGTGGVISDSVEAFESIDVTLLIVTISLVLTLLLAIYRSPVIAMIPIVVVGIAYTIAAAATYGLVQSGAVEVNGQTTAILIVLMFGAGTDYCLLIVARYREELRRVADKHEAMARATERTAPAILSAGGTVLAAMLVLTLADLKSTATMGPVLALGVAITILAGLTFLPALLSVLGRRAFWPAIPRQGSGLARPLGIWRRVGHLVHDRPVAALAGAVVLLGAGSLGNLGERGTIDFGEGFRHEVESVSGQRVIESKLTAGQTAATHVIVPARRGNDAIAALEQLEGVSSVLPMATSDDGRLRRIDLVLGSDPYSNEAAEAIPRIRRSAERVAASSMVGGTTAENVDTAETLAEDARLIVPLILALIFVILAILLRALVAPLYLVGTVVLSFAFALGASSLAFSHIFDISDSDPGLPTFAFIFLVALGVDYNIFLISRIREESAKLGNKEGVIAGLEKTGGVITSAGLILAGTFSALMALPLEALFQVGFTIALGLLVDTFLVRTVMVPSLAFMLGDKNWWPGRGSTASPH